MNARALHEPPGRLDPREVRSVVAGDPGWFGLESAPTAATLVGYGESYDAWRLDEIVVRVARRSVADLPRPVADEVAAYRFVPPEVGPALIAVDEAGDRFGGPCIVLSFVPGVNGADPALWDGRCLDNLAGQLVRLHATTSTGCGPVTLPEEERSRRLSAVDLHEQALAWWATHHGDLLERPEVTRLLEPAAQYVAAREPAFAALTRFVFAHADLIAANTLVDAGMPRLVDWEWAEFSDPARDLAYLGGRIPVPPFSVPLSAAARERLVAAYLAASGDDDAGAYGDATTMTARVEAWELHERFFTWLHHQSVVAAGRDPDGRYARAVAAADAGLRALLAPDDPA